MLNFEQKFYIKNKKKRIKIKNKGIKLRQLETKNNSLKIALHTGNSYRVIKRRKKLKVKNKPLGIFVTTTKIGISIHNSERFKKRLRKKKALLAAKQRKKPKLTPAQKSKAKRAAKLKKKLRKLKYK